jgi:hypothetical protein
VTETEAFAVVRVIMAAYPSLNWGDDTVTLWVNELTPLAAADGMTAAQEMYRTHNFATIANFRAELARLRERRADQAGPNFNRPALVSADRFLTCDENLAELSKVRAQLAAMKGPLTPSLRRALPRPMVTVPRADETYFNPEPEPGPQAEPPREVC